MGSLQNGALQELVALSWRKEGEDDDADPAEEDSIGEAGAVFRASLRDRDEDWDDPEDDHADENAMDHRSTVNQAASDLK
jgi:hypothetical protein